MILWPKWMFHDTPLDELVDTPYWGSFKEWLEKEETEVFSEYPSDQLKAMRRLVEDKENRNV